MPVLFRHGRIRIVQFLDLQADLIFVEHLQNAVPESPAAIENAALDDIEIEELPDRTGRQVAIGELLECAPTFGPACGNPRRDRAFLLMRVEL